MKKRRKSDSKSAKNPLLEGVNLSDRDGLIYELVRIMSKVDLESPEAELNITSFSIGKGRRMKY